MEINVFQVEMRAEVLKISPYENISFSFRITALHIQFAAH